MLRIVPSKIKNYFKSLTVLDYFVLLIMLAGILARGVLLGSVPGGVNADEAFAGYEAYSLLHNGVDSFGYSFPVYLVTWGSGMSALNTYMMIPFIALFGTHVWVIRLPEFIVSCCTLPVFYKLFKRLFNRTAAIVALFYLAVCPWSITSARWALDCNLAPAFILFGLYFFVLGAENSKYFIWSAFFYGLSLYCYALIWAVIPFIIGLQILYLIWTGKLHLDRYCIISVVLLGFIALPLILFYLINTGYIDEIITPFLSIPKLVMMRTSEISTWKWFDKLTSMFYMLIRQNDGYYWNAAPKYGLYYKWALPFAVIGLLYCAIKAIFSLFTRKFAPVILLVFQFVCAVAFGCCIEVNINRINSIHLPIISFISIGIYLVLNCIKKYFKYIFKVAYIGLAVCFICFMFFYFTVYRNNIGREFNEGLETSLARADFICKSADSEDNMIYIDNAIKHSKIMFYTKVPNNVYRETVVYSNYPSPYLSAASFANYVFEVPDASKNCVYILTEENIDTFVQEGWTIEQYGHTAVAYRQNTR
jgi:4-amino-4-deoxy-L-arabinose transferase-like glycosyltransferase